MSRKLTRESSPKIDIHQLLARKLLLLKRYTTESIMFFKKKDERLLTHVITFIGRKT